MGIQRFFFNKEHSVLNKEILIIPLLISVFGIIIASFAQICLLDGTVTQVSDVDNGAYCLGKPTFLPNFRLMHQLSLA